MERVKKVIHAKEVYQKGYTGKGVRIALLDTGVFLRPELVHNVVYFKDYIKHKKDCYDDNGHGTHIAGILTQMAPKA